MKVAPGGFHFCARIMHCMLSHLLRAVSVPTDINGMTPIDTMGVGSLEHMPPLCTGMNFALNSSHRSVLISYSPTVKPAVLAGGCR